MIAVLTQNVILQRDHSTALVNLDILEMDDVAKVNSAVVECIACRKKNQTIHMRFNIHEHVYQQDGLTWVPDFRSR